MPADRTSSACLHSTDMNSGNRVNDHDQPDCKETRLQSNNWRRVSHKFVYNVTHTQDCASYMPPASAWHIIDLQTAPSIYHQLVFALIMLTLSSEIKPFPVCKHYLDISGQYNHSHIDLFMYKYNIFSYSLPRL